jgi:hypothetical protein
MTATRPTAPDEAAGNFSPVDNELPLRWFRRLHLVPAGGLGTFRRAVFFAALTWLPIAIWASVTGHVVDPETGEALLRHYGVHVRCLVAVPLFILAEATLHGTVTRIASQFLSSASVGPEQQSAFRQTLAHVRGLRDSSLPWVFLLGATLAWLLVDHPSAHQDAYSWAVAKDGTLGFGGWWYAYVGRPIFVALLLSWLWRMLLVAYWLWRVGRLELSLVPAHPDRAGGLAFVEKLPGAFALVTFALAAVFASGWAHQIAYHDVTLEEFKLPAAVFAVFWTLFALLPLLALAPILAKTRARAIPAYADLVGEQGRLVHRRWILRENVPDSPILDAPEIGPVADAGAMYEAVRRMRLIPVGKVALAKILVPLAIPLIAVAALRIPVKQLLLDLVKTVL